MGQQKRLISFSDEVSEGLDKLVPSGERSEFVDKLTAEGLKRLKREKLIEIIDDFEGMKGTGEDSTEVLRKIRDEN